MAGAGFAYGSPSMTAGERSGRPSGAASLVVAAGIFLSRIAGFVRSRVLAHYLGNSDAADAFTYALRIPNMLQNLFGEGVLSASFIPVYARLEEEGRHEEARRVAGAVLSLLFLVVSVIVLLGILAAPLLVDVFAAGYSGEKRAALHPPGAHRVPRHRPPGAVGLVPGGAQQPPPLLPLVRRARCSGTLAIIAALVLEGRDTRAEYPLATAAALGAVAGSALQLLLQLPVALVAAARAAAGPGPRPRPRCARWGAASGRW